MALSSIHDGSHGNVNTTIFNHIVTGVDHNHHFRPNPDAKPFFPNQVHWTLVKENGKNGIAHQQFWYPEHENLLVGPGPRVNAPVNKKQHIAFHLVSNVLDDEVPEEKDNVNAGFNNSPRINMYDNVTHKHQISGGWRTTTEPLNLPLEMVKSNAENNSINNKSIHEIWSPDPSPNGLNNASPTEEINHYNISQPTQQTQQQDHIHQPPTQQSPQQQHQQQQQTQQQQNITTSPIEENANASFENSEQDQQHTSESFPTTINNSNGGVYEENESNRNKQHSLSQYYYPHVYGQPYVYRGMAPPPPHSHRYQDVYHPINPGRENIIPRPIVYSSGFYGVPPLYNKYNPHQRHDDARYKQKNYHSRQPEILYETKMNHMEELGIALDECRDQLRHLERDYKKADITLSQEFRLRKSSLGDNSNSNKYSNNATGVDKLITDQQKEHQKIESLIGRIERLGFTPMHPNVGVTLDSWLTSIKDLRNTRKNELASMPDGSGQYGSKSHIPNDLLNLIKSVKELAKHTRSARTVVWCAIQMLYANNITSNIPTSGD